VDNGAPFILKSLDIELVKSIFAGKYFNEYFTRDCKGSSYLELIKDLKKE